MPFRRTFKYRLYPSKNQQQTIDTQLELCRYLYNEILSVKKETFEQAHQSLSRIDLNKCILYYNTRIPELKQVHSQVKQDISDRIDKAFKNMYARIRRGEEKVGFPRYKGKGRYKSICYPQSGYYITPRNKLKISKIGEMNLKLHRPIKGDIKTLTINRTATNKYYATFSCVVDVEQLKKKPKNKNKSIGLDVGLNHFLTTSEGEQITNPQFYRTSEEKLARLQRIHSKKKLGSNHRKKSRLKVALLHEKIKHQRLDFTHKLSRYFIDNYTHIGIEDLNIRGMVQNKYLSKSIMDSGWSMFYNQLQYKAEYADSEVSQTDLFYPSSKLCNKCGNIQEMPLHKRTFKCNVCGNIEDRDTNAAINIDNECLRLTKMGQALPESVGDVGESQTQELMSMNQEAPSSN